MSVDSGLSNLEIVLPARSGSVAEGEAAHALGARTSGDRIGVVGDVGIWAPETLLSGLVVALVAAASAGWVPPAAFGVACGAAAVIVAAQAFGVRLLDGFFPRSPTWAVVVGPLGADTATVLALPIDVPVPAITVARLLLVGVLLLVPWVLWLPWPVAVGLLLVPPGLLLFRGAVPEVSVWFRQCAPIARAAGFPLVLAGGSRRDARGLLGALDWRRAGKPSVIWVVGNGGGVAHLPRSSPWRWPQESRRWLLDPAVLRLWLRGMDVWVLGGQVTLGSLSNGEQGSGEGGSEGGVTPLSRALQHALGRIDAARAMSAA